jgi:hypothetical protein
VDRQSGRPPTGRSSAPRTAPARRRGAAPGEDVAVDASWRDPHPRAGSARAWRRRRAGRRCERDVHRRVTRRSSVPEAAVTAEVVGHVRDHHVLAEQQLALDEQRRLVVEDLLPPAGRDELRQHDGHHVVVAARAGAARCSPSAAQQRAGRASSAR